MALNARCSRRNCKDSTFPRTTRRREMLGWTRTSPTVLDLVEKQILAGICPPPKGQFVYLADKVSRIWTISINDEDTTNTPLVLLHGMGSGVALWALNLPALAEHRPVYAIDMLGFGQSSRTQFSDDPELAEQQFVESIEQWRQAVGLESLILLGHSFGGFIVTAYSLRYAERVQHLILADPWGFNEPPSEEELNERLPRRIKIIRSIYNRINPFSPLRLAGPMGPWLMSKVRPELMAKFEPDVTRDMVANYLYHCNAQPPSGEIAFKTIAHNLGWAKMPMILRIENLPATLPMTMIHGEDSWIESNVALLVQRKRPNSSINIRMIKDAGHHVYADSPEEFNSIVSKECRLFSSRHKINGVSSPDRVVDTPVTVNDFT